MKKYNKPTIEALALETIDVIAASANDAADVAAAELAKELNTDVARVTKIAQDISRMGNTWSW